MEFLNVLLAQAPAPSSPAQPSPLGWLVNLLPIVAIIAIFWFLVFRPERKKQKKRQEMLQTLGKNDKVVTIGGIHGIVKSISDTEVVLLVDEKANVQIKFNRTAILGKVGGDDTKGEIPMQQ